MQESDMTQGSSPPQPQEHPPKKNSRRRCCLISLLIILLLLLILSIVILILSLTIFKPKQPRVRIQSAQVNGFASRLTFPNLDIKLNVTLNFQIHVQNRNRASFRHSEGKTLLYYESSQVGDAVLYPGFIPAQGSASLPCRLTLQVDKLADGLDRLIKDVIAGKLVIETRTEIPGRVNFLGIIKKHMKATSACKFTIGVPEMKLENQECKSKNVI